MSSGGGPAVVVTLGGINMDLVSYAARFPGPGETVVGQRFITYAGGKGANQAVAAARLGARSAMAGRVGDDLFGPQLRDGMEAAGVEVSGIGVSSGQSSGIAVISVDASAQNRIVQVLGANLDCGPAELAAVERRLPGASALLLQLETPPELSLLAAQRAAELGVSVILDPGPVRPFPEELLRLSAVVTPNETEAEALAGFPVSGPEAAARAAQSLLDRGAGAAVIKLGAQGAYYAADDGTAGIQPAFAVDAVDSVAAGDAFNAALAVFLTEGRTLAEAVRAGAAAGALAVTATGAQDAMPTRAAVETLLLIKN